MIKLFYYYLSIIDYHLKYITNEYIDINNIVDFIQLFPINNNNKNYLL